MTRNDALAELIAQAEIRAGQLRENARNAGKEGFGTHRNVGDSGRVAALWCEAMEELDRLRALAEKGPDHD